MRLLVEHFLKRLRRELDRDVRAVAPETLDLLRRYPWPGNVRELQSVLKQALLRCTGPALVPEFLPPALRGEVLSATTPSEAGWASFIDAQIAKSEGDVYAACLASMETQLFDRVLRRTAGNLSQAARLLGIDRSTLRSKLRTLGLKWTGAE
jgi:two-component system nitrogen regulation response regulator GlnG